jgi:hypothetical protein
MRKRGTGKVLKKCEFCKKEFYVRHDRIGKYCSKSCFQKDYSTNYQKIELFCDCCERKYFVRQKLK